MCLLNVKLPSLCSRTLPSGTLFNSLAAFPFVTTDLVDFLLITIAPDTEVHVISYNMKTVESM